MTPTLDRYVSKLKQPIPIILVVSLVFFVVLPFFSGEYWTHQFCEILILALYAYAFNILFAYTGYLSFGHAAFYGIAGYTVALMYFYDVSGSLWLAYLTALVITTVSGAVIGYFSVKLGRIYFAMLTLAFATMLYYVTYSWRSFTRGEIGLFPVPRGVLDFYFFEISLEPTTNFYFFTLIIFVACVLIIYRLVRSPFGYTLMQIRDNPERASFTGLSVFRYSWLAFIVSAFFAGLAGVLAVSLRGTAVPSILHWVNSLDPAIVALIGGVYAFSGPFIGSLIYILVRATLMSYIAEDWMMALGAILVVFVLFFRSGIMGEISKRFGIRL